MQELTQAEDTDPNERLQAQIPDVSGTFTRVNSIGALIFRIGFGGISYSIIINKEPPKPYSIYYGPYIRVQRLIGALDVIHTRPYKVLSAF